jgi:hypothetical protein
MTSNPWFRCFPDRLLSALGEMDADTQHVYAIVLLKIYARGGPIRNDARALATFCRRTMKATAGALERLIEMGRLTLVNGELSNPAAEAELEHQGAVSKARAEAGRMGGKKISHVAPPKGSEKGEEKQRPTEANAPIKIREEEKVINYKSVSVAARAVGPKPFPSDGPIDYAEPFAGIARRQGRGLDLSVLASNFRKFCHAAQIAFDDPLIARKFETFCGKHKLGRLAA